MSNFYDFEALNAKGEIVPMSTYKGQYVLVVNTASKCGFTPQYAGLEKLHQDLRRRSNGMFTVLGFPCNQFAGQEPGTSEEIQQFCSTNYNVSFPVMGKVSVNGDDAHPIWKFLKAARPGLLGLTIVKWNFEKFLVGPDGLTIARWATTTKPSALEPLIAAHMGPLSEPEAAPAPDLKV